MGIAQGIETDLAYFKQLIGAGWEGIASARQTAGGGVFMPSLRTAGWTPAAVGAALGLLGTRLVAGRRKPSTLVAGGLVGSVVGCGAALAWASRTYVGLAAGAARQRVNATRDARWLAMHPINYA